jgi:predicted lipid-binding transport protein (Tim44 family)
MATNDHDHLTDDAMEALFAEARAQGPAPSGDLMARILQDAEAETRARAAPKPSPRPRTSWLERLSGALGGWPALGGLVASTVLGLLLGVAQPSGLSGVTASLWGDGVSVTLGLDDDPLSLLEG